MMDENQGWIWITDSTPILQHEVDWLFRFWPMENFKPIYAKNLSPEAEVDARESAGPISET